MKKTIPAIALMLSLLLLLTMAAVYADHASPEESPDPASLLVGSWRMPSSPYGDDFLCYVVLNEDGSFMNVTNLYESGGTSGPYTQQVTTNETFRWTMTGSTGLQLHYSYLDDAGEFVTDLTYSPADDALYFYDSLYAVRDGSFVLVK